MFNVMWRCWMMDNLFNSDSDRKLIEQLELATRDLSWLSEAEYPFEVIYWQDISEINANTLLQRYNYPPETKIVIQTLPLFFARVTEMQDWHNQTEQTEVKQYQALVALIVENLRSPQVYLLGEIEIDAYILGKTTDNAIAGIATKIVAT